MSELVSTLTNTKSYFIPAGQTLTVVAATGGVGTIDRLADKPGDSVSVSSTAIASAETKRLGPWGSNRRYSVTCTAGEITSVTVGLTDVDVESGVGAASKAVVLNSSGNYTMPDGGFMDLSNAALAAAGSGQSTFAVIADQLNAVTGADGTKGVALPAASTGRPIFIVNTSQTLTLPVAPVNGGNDQINSLTAGTGVFTMGPGRAAWFFPTSATQWYVTGDAAIVGTPTEQDLDGLTASVAELNLVDTAIAGTVVNSKAAIYDAAGKLYRSSASPAGAGVDVTDATALTAELNYVTGANGTVGVVLPVAAANEVVEVINSVTTAGNYLNVYAITGSQINALGSTVAFQLNPGQRAVFIGRSSTLWNTAAASDTVSGLTASAAELNLNDGTTAGTVVASKTVAVDAQKAVDTLRATTNLNLGGTGVPGAASVQTEITKAVTAFTDTTAKDVFTVTIPNAAHAALIEVDCLGVLGAGGAIGAGESCKNSKYHVTVVRTAGVNAVATVSAEVGTGAAAKVAGAQDITSVVVTASAITGAVGDPNTFTIKVAITRSGAGADNHTLVASARVLNQNATGVTIA